MENLDKKELKKIYKYLLLYDDLLKNLWKRWNIQFKNFLQSKDVLQVEYFPNIKMDILQEKVVKIYEKYFWISVDTNEIQFIPKETIWWWFKVYFNDKMIDCSFYYFDNLIRKKFTS